MQNVPPYATIYEREVVEWATAAIQTGIETLRGEPGWARYDELKSFLHGEGKATLKDRSGVSSNRLRKVFSELISALTEVRQIWDYTTYNRAYNETAILLSRLTKAWWVNTASDQALGDALKYSGVGGAGYLAPIWDPRLPNGGDIRLVAFGPRDVIPIGPVYSSSVQDWQGVIIRERRSIEELRSRYPHLAHEIHEQSGSLFPDEMAFRDRPAVSTLDVLTAMKKGTQNLRASGGTCDFLRIFLKDYSLNTGLDPVDIGQKDEGWGYTVYPLGSEHPVTRKVVGPKEAMLFPRGRLITMIPSKILFDGPNPYLHGMFPVERMCLDPLPWLLLGLPFLADLLPLQKELDAAMRGMGNGMRQWFKRGIIADKNAVAGTTLRNIDTEAPGFQLKTNPVAGQGVKIVDGPNFAPWMIDYIKTLPQEMDILGGVQDLTSLSNLKQQPSTDTIQQYTEAQTHLIRLRARSIETSLGRVAEMVKCNIFQFYNAKRRVQILGDAGVVLDDFDYDPDNLIPAMKPTDAGYTEELDYRKDRGERIAAFHKYFTFQVTPGSLMAITHVQQRMMDLQLFRIGALDPYSLWESFGKKNIGAPPAETIPQRIASARRDGLMPGNPPEIAQLQQAMMIAQATMQAQQMAATPPGAPPGEPPAAPSGPPGQVGRPPSGQEAPKLETRDQGGRMVVSESG